MEKMTKILFIIIAAVAVCFAQAADTASKSRTYSPASQQLTVQNGYSSNSIKIDLTGITPKTKTNWSKIKDLFL